IIPYSAKNLDAIVQDLLENLDNIIKIASQWLGSDNVILDTDSLT
ncbi:18112_t:CDS:1, partial [Racocetra persica]